MQHDDDFLWCRLLFSPIVVSWTPFLSVICPFVPSSKRTAPQDMKKKKNFWQLRQKYFVKNVFVKNICVQKCTKTWVMICSFVLWAIPLLYHQNFNGMPVIWRKHIVHNFNSAQYAFDGRHVELHIYWCKGKYFQSNSFVCLSMSCLVRRCNQEGYRSSKGYHVNVNYSCIFIPDPLQSSKLFLSQKINISKNQVNWHYIHKFDGNDNWPQLQKQSKETEFSVSSILLAVCKEILSQYQPIKEV